MGAHGAFADLVFSLTEEIAHAAGIGSLRIDRFDIIDFSDAPSRVLLCNYPSNQIVTTIARGDLVVLFLLEPVADTLLFMERSLGIEPLASIRSQSASAVANLAIGQCNTVRYLDRTQDNNTLLQLTKNLSDFLGVGLTPEQCRALAGGVSLGLGCEAGVEEFLARRAEGLRGTDRDTVYAPAIARPWADVGRDVVDGALAMARFGSPRPIVWPTEVFSLGASRLKGTPGAVAAAGPSRNIYYGPYFYLPPSRYLVEVFVHFTADTTLVPFALEVHAGAWLTRATIENWHPGRLRGAFDLVHTDATSAVEIRLRNLAEITHGALSLIEILFLPERDESL